MLFSGCMLLCSPIHILAWFIFVKDLKWANALRKIDRNILHHTCALILRQTDVVEPMQRYSVVQLLEFRVGKNSAENALRIPEPLQTRSRPNLRLVLGFFALENDVKSFSWSRTILFLPATTFSCASGAGSRCTRLQQKCLC